MQYFVPKEIKSETKMSKRINLKDFAFVSAVLSISMVMDTLVYAPLKVVYYIFSVLSALVLTIPSRSNPNRRNYQGLMIFIRKQQEDKFYKSIKNISFKRKNRYE